MVVYIFGNQDMEDDNITFKVAKKIKNEIDDISFFFVKPNQDLPFVGEKRVVIMDTVDGIDEVSLIDSNEWDKFILPPRTTVHDFDLGFQLKYLKKLGKLGEVYIIGLPMKRKIDYLRIQSILRKLTAQDIQGS